MKVNAKVELKYDSRITVEYFLQNCLFGVKYPEAQSNEILSFIGV